MAKVEEIPCTMCQQKSGILMLELHVPVTAESGDIIHVDFVNGKAVIERKEGK